MYKSFSIFLLLYFCGAGEICGVGEVNSILNKFHNVLTALDIDTEEERSLNDWQKGLLESACNNPFGGLAFVPDSGHTFSVECGRFAYLILDNNRAAQRPLFLLFHSFLFYELLF